MQCVASVCLSDDRNQRCPARDMQLLGLDRTGTHPVHAYDRKRQHTVREVFTPRYYGEVMIAPPRHTSPSYSTTD